MRPKLKAEILIDKYAYLVGRSCVNTDIQFEADFSKECALIACSLLQRHSKDKEFFTRVKAEIKKYKFPFEKHNHANRRTNNK